MQTVSTIWWDSRPPYISMTNTDKITQHWETWTNNGLSNNVKVNEVLFSINDDDDNKEEEHEVEKDEDEEEEEEKEEEKKEDEEEDDEEEESLYQA